MVRLLLMALLKAAYYLCVFIDYSTQKKADTEGGKRVMKYDTITRAAFIKRPNRFVAEVDIDGKRETVHVKNTGRCKELIKAKKAGYKEILAFVIQMDGVTEVRPNVGTHPEFGEAMDDARKAGVEIRHFTCHVTPDTLEITGRA